MHADSYLLFDTSTFAIPSESPAKVRMCSRRWRGAPDSTFAVYSSKSAASAFIEWCVVKKTATATFKMVTNSGAARNRVDFMMMQKMFAGRTNIMRQSE